MKVRLYLTILYLYYTYVLFTAVVADRAFENPTLGCLPFMSGNTTGTLKRGFFMDKTQELLRRIELKCQEIDLVQGRPFELRPVKKISRQIRKMIDEYRKQNESIIKSEL